MKLLPFSGLQKLRKAWAERGQLGDKNLDRTERAFLPAALEILETPPSPIGRILAWTIMAFFFIAVAWACFGHVDIVTVAQGKIIPSGRVKVIQPLEKGVVKEIYVKEYQFVNQGEPLVELDRTITQAEQVKLARELSYIETTIRRQETFVELLKDPRESLTMSRVYTLLPAGAKDETGTDQAQLLYQQWKSYQSKRETLSSELKEKDAGCRASEEIVKQLEETLPLIARQLEAYETLKKTGAVSDFACMEKQKEFIDQRQSLAAERKHHEQLASAVHTIESEIRSLDAEARREALAEIQEAGRQRRAIEQELTKATDLNARQVLTAPVSGVVQQLSVNTIGGVVTEAQPLMLIVPKGEKLEAEVDVENKDIGFVKEGQKAEIKVNTFPFTRYGVIDADVTDITHDAVMDEKENLVYKMRLVMAKSTMMVDGKEVNLSPGMAVTTEIKTGKRRLIEFFLSPLIQYVDESVRER